MADPLASYPIHRAACDGDLALLDRLLAEDPGRLNAQVQGVTTVDGWSVKCCTALMLAAWKGRDGVVARLLTLGADVMLGDAYGWTAAHWACRGHHASALALLLDAGASINERDEWQQTPLIIAAVFNAVDCVALLLARGGPALELDAVDQNGRTALHCAAHHSPEIASVLLQAGADPTIRDPSGETPLDIARFWNKTECIALLEAGMAEPQRARSLLKARALCDATSHADARIPRYPKGRVERNQPLPSVEINTNTCEELGACLRFVLGLEGHGGWAGAEDERATMWTEGLFPELFIELCELLVPKWDRANV